MQHHFEHGEKVMQRFAERRMEEESAKREHEQLSLARKTAAAVDHERDEHLGFSSHQSEQAHHSAKGSLAHKAASKLARGTATLAATHDKAKAAESKKAYQHMWRKAEDEKPWPPTPSILTDEIQAAAEEVISKAEPSQRHLRSTSQGKSNDIEHDIVAQKAAAEAVMSRLHTKIQSPDAETSAAVARAHRTMEEAMKADEKQSMNPAAIAGLSCAQRRRAKRLLRCTRRPIRRPK
jgi:hypothetical protein